MRIPQELLNIPRWVCCTADKLPIDPKTGKAADSTDPATWADYATAAAAVTPLGCRGVGLVLGDGFAGIDLDHCIDPATSVVDDTALDIVDAMQSYTEISPSGTGLHILWRGEKAGKACRRALGNGVGLEMYDGGRYFTVTGRSWHDPPLPLAERTDEAAQIYRQYLDRPRPAAPTAAQARPVQPRPAGAPSDSEILEKAKQAKGGEKLAALLAGDWQPYAPSRSEADLALCNLLAFWLGADKARMDAAFRASGLYRPKWDERRGADTYGNITLDRALADCQEIYDPTPAPPQVSAEEAKAEVADLLRSMGIAPSKKPEQAPVPAAPAPGRKTYSLDDTGNARRFRDLYGEKVRYNYSMIPPSGTNPADPM